MSLSEKIHIHTIYTKKREKTFSIAILHGWGKNGSLFLPLAHLLAGIADVHLVDLPGFGNSSLEKNAHAPSLEEITDALVEKFHSFSQFPSVWIGHSFGGKIALLAALKTPLVKKIVALSPAIHSPPRFFSKRYWRSKCISLFRFCVKKWDYLWGTQFFSSHFIPRFASKDYLDATPLQRLILVKHVNFNLLPLCQRIEQDVLLLWGAKDSESPLEGAYLLERALKKAQLHIYPEKEHDFCEGTGGHLVYSYIAKFLENSKGLG